MYGDTINLLPGTYSAASGEVFPIQLAPGIRLEGAGVSSTFISGQSDQTVLYIGSSTVDFNNDTGVSHLTIQDGDIGIELYSTQGHFVRPIIEYVRARWNNLGIKLHTSDVYHDGAEIGGAISNSEVSANTSHGIFIRSYGYFSPSTIATVVADSLIAGNGANGIYLESLATSGNGTTAAPHILRSQISNNANIGIKAEGQYQGWVEPHIESSVIDNNAGFGVRWDAGINSGNLNAMITNTVIAHNQAGGVYLGNAWVWDSGRSSFKLINSNVVNNQALGLVWEHVGSEPVEVTLLNSIVWNPFADDLAIVGPGNWSTDQITYSDIEDGDLAGQVGNFSTDPLLTDDYHLTACSPAINAGTNAGAPLQDRNGESRPLQAVTDVGADELEAPCLLETDLSVSSNTAKWGDLLAYTIAVTNTTVLTPVSLVVSDTLPSHMIIEPDSAWASAGTASIQGNTLRWSDTVAAGTTLKIGFLARAALANTVVRNIALANAGQLGLYRSPEVWTSIEPVQTYLPVIDKSSPGVIGRVTLDGVPIGGVSLELRYYYPGSGWYTWSTTITAADGRYVFTTAPTYPGQPFYVRYLNTTTPSRLYSWSTRLLSNFTAGSNIYAGDFDIGNIHLLDPAAGTTIPLPQSFTWQIRAAAPTDSYEYNLFDPTDGEPYFFTAPPLGYIGTYQLSGLPPGFSANTPYVWDVWVYSPDGGIGISYYAYYVAFSSGAQLVGPLNGSLPLSQIENALNYPAASPHEAIAAPFAADR